MSLPTFLRQSLFTDDTPFLDDAFQLFLFDQELSGSYYIETASAPLLVQNFTWIFESNFQPKKDTLSCWR